MVDPDPDVTTETCLDGLDEVVDSEEVGRDEVFKVGTFKCSTDLTLRVGDGFDFD